MSKLAYIKIISGDYVLGEIVENNENEIKLKKPLATKFEMMLGGLQMYPYDAFYLSKELEEISFKKEHVIHIFEGDDIPFELESKYREFVSGIVKAPAGMNMEAGAENNDLQRLILGGK